jgi:hypothetical protein
MLCTRVLCVYPSLAPYLLFKKDRRKIVLLPCAYTTVFLPAILLCHRTNSHSVLPQDMHRTFSKIKKAELHRSLQSVQCQLQRMT